MAANRIRHWKQRFDADAEFVFTRRLKLGISKKNPWVQPGDPVPKGDIRIQGRLKRWWEAGVIALADWESPEAAREQALAKQAEELEEARDAVAEITKRLPGFRARLAELEADADTDPRDLEGIRSTIAQVREVLFAAQKLGVELPEGILDEPTAEEALAALDTFDLPPEKPEKAPAAGEGLLDPVEPPQGPAEGSELPAGESGAGAPEAPEAPAPADSVPPGPQAPEDFGEVVLGSEAQGGSGEVVSDLDEILVESTGGGWFSVTVPGEDEPRKVQGEAKLEALLTELKASE